MRDIEFRGKRESQTTGNVGDWVYGSLVWDGERIPMIYSPALSNGYQWNYVKLETVGQFTGLKDEKGVKIFEGDIVSFSPVGAVPIRGYIKYYDGCFVIKEFGEYAHFHDLREYIKESAFRPYVIGNIHDNPELLEAEK